MPKQFISVCDTNTVNCGGSTKTLSVVSKHPLESSETTVYIPAARFKILELVTLFCARPVDQV